MFYLDLILQICKIQTPTNATVSSHSGKEIQTPTLPNNVEKIIAIGIIKTNPRSNDTICAGVTLSHELKYVDIIILKPTNGTAVK